ncbi:hypothetical protein TNCV_3219391 [Trichonephila clavipes]|nr:hypothetical protein TNCV_3219391 [Trichonephila clavipes]
MFAVYRIIRDSKRLWFPVKRKRNGRLAKIHSAANGVERWTIYDRKVRGNAYPTSQLATGIWERYSCLAGKLLLPGRQNSIRRMEVITQQLYVLNCIEEVGTLTKDPKHCKRKTSQTMIKPP